ncbi:MAG: hypothetical protein ACJAY8_001477 [Sphingobacteriales bacterium]|jgi:hypothetical protein
MKPRYPYIISSLILVSFLFGTLIAEAQKDSLFAEDFERQHNLRPSIGLELFGSGAKYSVAIEGITRAEKKFPIVIRLGLGVGESGTYFNEKPVFEITEPYYTFSQQIIFLKRHGVDNCMEYGLGGVWSDFKSDSPSYTIFPSIGYRMFPLWWKNGMLRFFAQVPLLRSPQGLLFMQGDKTSLFTPFGFSVGYTL